MCLFMTILYVALFICLPVTTKAENFYISSYGATDLKTATKQCNLAEPELKYSSTGVHVNLPSHIITVDVWIGYYIARTALEYFGCAKAGYYTPTYRTPADPGQCLSACGVDKVIGISGNKCFCFNQDENIGNGATLFPYCNENCNDLSGIVCGKSGYGNAYMSLYRSIGPNISSVGNQYDVRGCMYNINNGFDWRRCDYIRNFMCEKDNRTSISSDRKTWKRGTISCFEKRERPSTYKNTQSVKASHTWTGIIRSLVIYKYSTHPILFGYAQKYVYISYNNGDPVVANRSLKTYRNMKILCHNDTTTTTSTTTTTRSHKKTTETSEPSSRTTTSRSLMTSTERETNETSPDSKQVTTETGPSASVIVATPVSIVVVIVILIIVIVILCLCRRGTKKTQPSHLMNVRTNNANASSASCQNQQNTGNEDEFEIATAALGDEPESDYAYENIELKKTDNTYDSTKDKTLKRGIQSAPNPYSNSGCGDDQYDTTEGVHQKPKEKNANPYSYLGGYEEESSNYDHIGKGKKATAGRNVTAHDTTYNTTNLGFLKTGPIPTENLYSVVGANETDDTYSHINAKKTYQTRSKSSENNYDTLKK